MTKYIHYTKSYHMGVLISNEPDESAKGYRLGLEIECPCFDNALTEMRSSRFTPYDIKGGIVTNETIIGFKDEFMRILDMGVFLAVPYSMKIHRDGFVTVYCKTTEA